MLLEIVVGKPTYVWLNFLNTFNSSFGSFTVSESTLIHAKEFVAVGGKHLSEEGVIVETFTVAVDVVDHTFFLNVSLDWVAVSGYAYVVFSFEVVGFRPDELFVINIFIIVLPILKRNPISIVILHILAPHISRNSP